jgi:hypothetical protein
MLGWKCFSIAFAFIGLRSFHKTSKPRRRRNTPVYNWPTVSQAEREPLWNIATVSLSIVMRKHLNQESTSGVRTIRVMDFCGELSIFALGHHAEISWLGHPPFAERDVMERRNVPRITPA